MVADLSELVANLTETVAGLPEMLVDLTNKVDDAIINLYDDSNDASDSHML
jgi:hypothetical protein